MAKHCWYRSYFLGRLELFDPLDSLRHGAWQRYRARLPCSLGSLWWFLVNPSCSLNSIVSSLFTHQSLSPLLEARLFASDRPLCRHVSFNWLRFADCFQRNPDVIWYQAQPLSPLGSAFRRAPGRAHDFPCTGRTLLLSAPQSGFPWPWLGRCGGGEPNAARLTFLQPFSSRLAMSCSELQSRWSYVYVCLQSYMLDCLRAFHMHQLSQSSVCLPAML